MLGYPFLPKRKKLCVKPRTHFLLLGEVIVRLLPFAVLIAERRFEGMIDRCFALPHGRTNFDGAKPSA
jgi:hypothetical protein